MLPPVLPPVFPPDGGVSSDTLIVIVFETFCFTKSLPATLPDKVITYVPAVLAEKVHDITFLLTSSPAASVELVVPERFPPLAVTFKFQVSVFAISTFIVVDLPTFISLLPALKSVLAAAYDTVFKSNPVSKQKHINIPKILFCILFIFPPLNCY